MSTDLTPAGANFEGLTARLARNLAALLRWSPTLVDRLLAVRPMANVGLLPWPPFPAGERVALLGATAADAIHAALGTGQHIWLWDRSAPMLRALLESEDFASVLSTGQLQLACDLELWDRPPGVPGVTHPALAHRYAHELRWLEVTPARRAMLVEGGLLIEELARALEADGFGLWTWETQRLPIAELERIAQAFAPELVVAVNHQGGLAEAVERLALKTARDVKLRVWEIDPALDPVRSPVMPVPRARIHTWRKANVEPFRRAGYAAEYLPLASDPTWRHPISLSPEEASEYGAPVTFVGRSMVAEAQRYRQQLVAQLAGLGVSGERVDSADADARLEEVLTEQRLMPESYRVPELLEAAFPGSGSLAGLAGEVAAAEFRLTVVANLASFGAHVWGDEGWKQLEEFGVRWRGPAGHRHQLPRIYSNGGIHVDVGRIYQLDIVTLRVFDALACGAFLIAHHNDDLVELFSVGDELESWSTISELREKVAFYLAHPESAQRIASRGRERVLRDHTVHQRLARMLAP